MSATTGKRSRQDGGQLATEGTTKAKKVCHRAMHNQLINRVDYSCASWVCMCQTTVFNIDGVS